jgi:hypothetical protein
MNTTSEPGESVTPLLDLSKASPSDLMIYGLTLDDDYPDRGVLVAARRDLGLLVSLAQSCPPGVVEIDIVDWAEGLERIARRMDVAIELLTRARRAQKTSAPAAIEAVSIPEEKQPEP